MTIGDWTELFRGTRQLPRRVRDRLLSLARVVRLPGGRTVFGPARVPDHLLFLVEGVIRVQHTSGSGREIVLYRVEAGQSCVLTTACMLAEEAYEAEGVAETDVVAVALPRGAFDTLASEEPAFLRFVFAAFSRRLIDLMHVVDEVAFGRIDMRLAARLLALAGETDEVAATHQQLASELGTAREVVSRVLQDFQRRGLIAQARGRIGLSDRHRLEAIAHSEGSGAGTGP